jgi:hypothetical protein
MRMVKLKLIALIISITVLTGIVVFSFLPALLPQLPRQESQQLSFQRILRIQEDTEYWIAYESPSEHGLSLAWGDGYLWMADIYDGAIYKAKETEEGLGIVKTWDLRIQPSNVFQMRDITWDGQTLWSVSWGSIQKHDPETMKMIFEYHEEPPWENMHHMWNIAWDGKHIWSGPEQLNRHNPEDYYVEAVYPSAGFPMNIAFRNESELWVSDSVWGYIYQLDMSQPPPQIINTYSIVERPYGIAWSDKNLWVYDLTTKRIYKIKKLPDFPLDPTNEYLKEENYTFPGEIFGNVTWTLDKSPYVVESIAIPEGSTLTIEPGVKVFVKGEVIIQGTLNAIGTREKPIVFTHVDWDKPAFGDFFFGDPNHEAVYSEGEEASASILKYVTIEYFQNGIQTLNAFPTIEYSIIRKNLGAAGAIQIRLEKGNYSTLKFVGNKISEGGDGIKIEIGPEAKVSNITIKENIFEKINGAPIYIEYRGKNPPEVLIEHNILDYAHGAATIFDGSFNLVFRHNFINDMVAYRGVMPTPDSKVEISYNFIRHTFQAGIQLDDPSFRNVTVRYNTIIDSIVDSDWGNPNVKVEYNNILFNSEVKVWASGLDATENKTARMPNNWWGTPDLEEVRKHIADSKTTPDAGPLIIEPILTEPNGIGFLLGLVKDKVTGKPISEAKITIGNITLSSAVDGKFFSAMPEGLQSLTISAPSYQTREFTAEITSAEVNILELELLPEAS